MDEGCHIAVKRSHELVGGFNECDIYPKLTEIFRNFDSDKPSADNNCGFWIFLIYKFLDFQRVSTVRSVNILSLSMPSKFGLIGFAPGDNMSLS